MKNYQRTLPFSKKQKIPFGKGLSVVKVLDKFKHNQALSKRVDYDVNY